MEAYHALAQLEDIKESLICLETSAYFKIYPLYIVYYFLLVGFN